MFFVNVTPRKIDALNAALATNEVRPVCLALDAAIRTREALSQLLGQRDLTDPRFIVRSASQTAWICARC